MQLCHFLNMEDTKVKSKHSVFRSSRQHMMAFFKDGEVNIY